MLARGIRSYQRPDRIEEALDLAEAGVRPLAGGTRLLATAADTPEVLDLASLDLGGIEVRDGDLLLGATVSLQDVIDSPLAYGTTGGLLPAACRAHSASRTLRGMATLAGESVFGSSDSEVAAALLALNAIYVVRRREATVEVPALRFLRNPREDLGNGGLVTSILLPGAPGGAALERLAVLPSAPALLAVAATVSLAGGTCTRARVALTGLEAAPARVLEGESRLEGSDCSPDAVGAYVEQVTSRVRFRTDAHASADYRRAVAPPLIARALSRAVDRARSGVAAAVPRLRPRPAGAPPPSMALWRSGELVVTVNGARLRGEAHAGTTLLEWLRARGLWSVKHGCETGECGACTVLLEGRPVSACLTLAPRAQGLRVDTVEGLGTPGRLHPVQAAFVETGAIQCGFCTPAMELCAAALLDEIPDPTEPEVRDALSGCLCRCTGYVKPVEAVLRAAKGLGGSRKAVPRDPATAGLGTP